MDVEKYNREFLEKVSHYLNFDSGFLSKKLVQRTQELMRCGVEEAVIALLSSKMELDPVEVEYYLKPSLRCLDREVYQRDLYYQNVSFSPTSFASVSLEYEKYEPFFVFVCNDLEKMKDGRVLPSLGYFEEEYLYPCVKEEKNIWMLITPNEIETMKVPIERAKGSVVTYGLGLGYFAYMASLKEDVSSIVIVENNFDVISLFEKKILPFFPHPEKIHIVFEDAYTYAKKKKKCDYVFVDIYHDVSDGIDAYLSFKLLERDDVIYDYWIEKSILCYF